MSSKEDVSPPDVTEQPDAGDEKAKLLPARQHRHPTSKRPPFLRLLALLAVLLIAFYALINRSHEVRELPSSYAICSKRGRQQLRTLDAADTLAECMIVRDGIIADMGSLRDLRSRWRDKDTVGGPGSIKFHFLCNAEETIFPGLCAHAAAL